MYDYRHLARKYADSLPPSTAVDWEDIYQEMCLHVWRYPSIKSVHWAARRVIRHEWIRAKPKELPWAKQHSVRLDTICEAYRLIQRWPWLIGLMIEGSGEALGKKLQLTHAAIPRRINRIRARLGIAKRYKK